MARRVLLGRYPQAPFRYLCDRGLAPTIQEGDVELLQKESLTFWASITTRPSLRGESSRGVSEGAMNTTGRKEAARKRHSRVVQDEAQSTRFDVELGLGDRSSRPAHRAAARDQPLSIAHSDHGEWSGESMFSSRTIPSTTSIESSISARTSSSASKRSTMASTSWVIASGRSLTC